MIISNIAHTVYIRFTAFSNFSKLLFDLHILAFTKFLLRWCAPWKLWWTLFKSSFPTLDTLCRLDLQCFQTFPNCSLFCTFGFYEISTVLMRIMLTMANIVLIITCNIARTVCIRFIGFWNFSKLQFVLQILAFTKFLLRWCAPWKLWWTLFKSSFPTLDTLCRLDLQCFPTFRNCCLFCTFWLLRNFYSGDGPHGNCGEPCSSHHFRHWTHCVD